MSVPTPQIKGKEFSIPGNAKVNDDDDLSKLF